MHTVHTHDDNGTDLTLSLEEDHVHLQVVNNAYTPTGDLSVDALRELAKAATELADTLEQQRKPAAELPMEFVVFDKDENVVDSVDPYVSHTRTWTGGFMVRNSFNHDYPLFVPEGGSYMIRPRED